MDASFVELHARSAFSFLRAASQPEALAQQAAALDLPAIAVCDRDGVYGSARVHAAAREAKLRAIVGAELTLDDGSVLPVLVQSREGCRNLCELITRAKLRLTKHRTSNVEHRTSNREPAPQRPSSMFDVRCSMFDVPPLPKGHTPVQWDELAEFSAGLVALTGDEEGPIHRCLASDNRAAAIERVERLTRAFGKGNVLVEIQRHLRRGEDTINDALVDLAEATRLPLLATNGVLHATREERRVLDIFTCARHHTHLDAAGRLLAMNDERYLKSARQMQRLFRDHPDAVANTVRLAERLEFSLENLGYEFPRYDVPAGETMDSFLRKVTMAGARARYSHLGPRVSAQLRHELDLITRLGFSGYFLIVWDIVNFCTEQGILVQGRGSAANSVVCYSLGITACDPIACNLLFERFLSEGRKSWPDIDLDLPSGDRRERVIQEVYRRYGPDGAAMTANVITFRGKSAMREIGKALNFPPDVLNRFSHLFGSGDFRHTLELEEQVAQAGLPLDQPRTRAALDLYGAIYGLPRHLGQHSGGMIICQGQLSSVVPLENASMSGRVVAQWDKDDCEDLGIIKVDLLGLGMMAAMQDALEMCAARGRPVDLAAIPKDDEATYDLLCAADTIGTFQVESRAQMATLPRMQPRCFYDVVVEVAIIRPGPIQGDMLHPYLARRSKKEPVTYFDERLRPVLERTLGVPLFQEQLLKIAMVMADFSGSEAEELRRALSFHRSQEKMNKVCVKLRAGMGRNGVATEVIDQVTKAVQSFAVYGFPESHAISFALIAYASCWMKVHRAPEFYAGLLNNQPMGFYSPATLVVDAKRHGVPVKAVSVLESDWLCTVEERTMAEDRGTTETQRTRREVKESQVIQNRADTGVARGPHEDEPSAQDPAPFISSSSVPSVPLWSTPSVVADETTETQRAQRREEAVEPTENAAASVLASGTRGESTHAQTPAPSISSSSVPSVPLWSTPSTVAGETTETQWAQRREEEVVPTENAAASVLASGTRGESTHAQTPAPSISSSSVPSVPLWSTPSAVLRLGLCVVRGLAREDGERIVTERKRAPFTCLADFQLRTQLPQTAMRTLAKIGALNGLAEHRRDAQWRVEVARAPEDLFAHAESQAALPLAPMPAVDRTRADFSGTGLTTGPHPMAYLRPQLPNVWRAADLPQARTGTLVQIAGQVICRQRPGTAKGFVFISLEDETGTANAIVLPQLFEERRLTISEEPFLLIEGVVQNIDRVIHVKARKIEPLLARNLPAAESHDFH